MKPNTAPLRAAAVMLPLTLLIACGSGSGVPASPAVPLSQGTPVPSPAPPSGPYTVEGEVFAFATGMIGNANIDLWVQQDRFGYSYWWANGPLQADAIGQFKAGNLPASDITILAFAGGYVQPCAVTVDVRDDLAVRIEMIPVSTLDAFNPPRPQLSTEPSLTGVIFEATATGRQPIVGAALWAESPIEVSLATTMSDRGGGFFLCNLGPTAWLHVDKDGFEARWIGPIDSSESQVLEIELKRL